jgi:hypothetical protein
VLGRSVGVGVTVEIGDDDLSLVEHQKLGGEKGRVTGAEVGGELFEEILDPPRYCRKWVDQFVADCQSCIPKPSKIAGVARSMRAVRVLDCLAALKWRSQPRRRPGVRRVQASRRAGSVVRRLVSSVG